MCGATVTMVVVVLLISDYEVQWSMIGAEF
jgi:hypothetical protein